MAADQRAAQEMVRRSGQMGVPVITAGSEVIVGFDRARLARIAEQHRAAGATRERPRLGLLVKEAPGTGVAVGGARPGSPAERAGFRPGDILVRLDGRPIQVVADVERATQGVQPGQVTEAEVQRAGQPVRLRIAW